MKKPRAAPDQTGRDRAGAAAGGSEGFMSEPQTARGSDETFCSAGFGEPHHWISRSVNAGLVRFIDICSQCEFISSERIRLQVEPLDLRTLEEQRMWPFPETAIVGMQRGKWPVQIFTESGHALGWIEEEPDVRRLRRVRLLLVNEMRYIPPGPGRLVDVDATDAR